MNLRDITIPTSKLSGKGGSVKAKAANALREVANHVDGFETDKTKVGSAVHDAFEAMKLARKEVKS